MSKRVLLAGMFHETHTFLEGRTTLDDFQVRRGDELLTTRGDGSPLSGAIEVADACGWELIPIIDLRATPSPTVEDRVVEEFWSAFESAALAATAENVDGVFLVLHGAMACETILDPEGEVVSRIRRLPGFERIPICGVLDLHGNISRESIVQTQGLAAYRNNPHTDACESAARGAQLLDRILSTGEVPTSVWAQPSIVWPPTGVGTADDPMRTLEAKARDIEQNHPQIAIVNVMAGYAFADTPMTGVSFAAVTFGDPAEAQRRIDELADWAEANRELGNVVDPPLPELMPEIAAQAARGEGPLLVVEPSDNIGGGAPGDGTSVLRELLKHGVKNAAVVINDPAAVESLQEAAVGEIRTLSLGGRGSRLAEGPVTLEVKLLSRSDGQFDLEDRHSHLASMVGTHVNMGPSAVVEHQGIRILLTTRKTPPFDLGQLRSQGIEPESLSVIGVKAAVAHRQAYDPIQRGSYTVFTPGPCASDLRIFPYQHLRRPIFPLDDEITNRPGG